jgi:WD40-like Beta Propeller Repeat
VRRARAPRAAVAELLRRAVGASDRSTTTAPAPRARPVAAARLPGGGRILLAGAGGATMLGAGPARRLATPATAAAWSALGHFAAVGRGRRLLAVDLRGVTRWSLIAPGAGRVHAIAWEPRDGQRVAYLVGADARRPAVLRVVAGDGSGDRAVGTSLASVTPAWEPRSRRRLAWATGAGDVVLADLDRRVVRWRLRAATARSGRIVDLAWSGDGRRLLVVGARRTLLLEGATGTVLRRAAAPAGERNVAAAFVPGGGREYALTRRAAGGRSRVSLLTRNAGHSLLSVDGDLSAPWWSPDGRWLAVASGRADALLLLAPRGGRLAALRTVPGLRGRFGAGHLPRLAGWCCSG